MPRALPILACCAAALVAAPAPARTPLKMAVSSFDLVQVNQEVFRVKPGGSHPLCQAIPLTAIRAHLKWSHARKGSHARVSFDVPRHAARSRTITLAGASGTRRLEFTPRTEHLTDEAFPGGRYVVVVKAGDRTVTRGTLTLTQETKTC